MAGTSEFRQIQSSLLKQKSWVGLSPSAKATYLVLRLLLPSYGLGQCSLETLPLLVGCKMDALEQALTELANAGYFERDDDNWVYWLCGAEASLPWNSSKYVTHYRNTIAELPASQVVDRFKAWLAHRYGIDGPSIQIEKEPEPQVDKKPKKQAELKPEALQKEKSRTTTPDTSYLDGPFGKFVKDAREREAPIERPPEKHEPREEDPRSTLLPTEKRQVEQPDEEAKMCYQKLEELPF